jgi:hypothetical protein
MSASALLLICAVAGARVASEHLVFKPAVQIGTGLDSKQPASEQAPGFERFARALSTYMALRTRVTEEVASLTVTTSPAEIESTSNRLAAAITRGRSAAAPGEFFGPPVDAEVRRRLQDVARKLDLRAIVMPADEDERSVAKVTLHGRFPAGTAVSTMPPSVLAILPAIPSTLEYRFVGTTLILRDVEAALILDFLPKAVP